jgi:hypothetical protein
MESLSGSQINVWGHVVGCWMDNPGDPDVAGVGVSKANILTAIYRLSVTNRPRPLPQVIASFVATALITILTIIIAYVARSLPPDRYNRVDDAFLSAISRTFHRQTKAQPASPEAAPTPVEDSSGQLARATTVECFILALSDQQLVAGIAILVAI